MLPLFALVMAAASAGVLPTVSSVVANGASVGDPAGGYTATLTGTGFVVGGTSFAIGGTALTGVSVTSATTATGVMPAKGSGNYAVTATTTAGTSTVTASFEYFSIADLALTLFVEAPYAYGGAGTSSWVAKASAGSSGAFGNLTNTAPAFSPTTGAALNGRTTCAFDGASQYLNTPSGSGTPWGASGSSIIGLVFLTSAIATTGTINALAGYGDPAILQDSAGNNGIIFSSSGISYEAVQASTSTYKAVTKAMSTGAWHLFMATHDGTTLSMYVDSAAVATAACGPQAIAGDIVIDRGYAGASPPGRFAMLAAAAQPFTAAQFAKIKGYANTRNNLSL